MKLFTYINSFTEIQLAEFASESGRAEAGVIVDSVLANGSVKARRWQTLVHVLIAQQS